MKISVESLVHWGIKIVPCIFVDYYDLIKDLKTKAYEFMKLMLIIYQDMSLIQ